MKLAMQQGPRMLLVLAVFALMACHGGTDLDSDAGLSDGSDEDGAEGSDKMFADMGPGDCNALTNINAVEIRRGEQTFCRHIDNYSSFEFSVEDYSGTAIHLADLIDADIAEVPEDWRYQAYGTDGYTFGGYASWSNMQNGYLELTTRRIVFESSEELDHSFFVKDSYLIVLTPAGS